MKKFFSFVAAAAVIALSFTACDKKGGNDPDQPTTPTDTTQVTPADPANVIEINISQGVRFVDAVATEGWWQIIAQNEEYMVSLSNNVTTQVSGTYGIDDLDMDYSYIVIVETEETLGLVEGSVTLTVSTENVITAQGQFLATDDNTYKLTIIKTPAGPVDLTLAITETADGLLVTPSNDEDAWDFNVLSTDEFAEYYDNDADAFAEDSYAYYGDYFAAPGEYLFPWAELAEYCEEPGEYVLVVWGANEDAVTTEAVSLVFTLADDAFSAPAAAPAKKAPAKALKVVKAAKDLNGLHLATKALRK